MKIGSGSGSGLGLGLGLGFGLGLGLGLGFGLIKKRRRKMARTIEISDETYEKIKDQLTSEEDVVLNNFNDAVGKKFFFRTLTYHLVGEVKAVIVTSGKPFFHLSKASWVADSGRFSAAIKNGTLSEVEPVGEAFVNLDSVTDFFPWKHSLPTKVK